MRNIFFFPHFIKITRNLKKIFPQKIFNLSYLCNKSFGFWCRTLLEDILKLSGTWKFKFCRRCQELDNLLKTLFRNLCRHWAFFNTLGSQQFNTFGTPFIRLKVDICILWFSNFYAIFLDFTFSTLSMRSRFLARISSLRERRSVRISHTRDNSSHFGWTTSRGHAPRALINCCPVEITSSARSISLWHNFWNVFVSLTRVSALWTVSPISVISETVFRWLSKLIWEDQMIFLAYNSRYSCRNSFPNSLTCNSLKSCSNLLSSKQCLRRVRWAFQNSSNRLSVSSSCTRSLR